MSQLVSEPLTVSQHYHNDLNNPSNTVKDIMELLFRYSKTCSHILTFLNLNSNLSFPIALLYGLNNSPTTLKKTLALVGSASTLLQTIQQYTQYNQISIEQNDIQTTDMLFIDSYHCYGQLKRELLSNHHKVRKVIVIVGTSQDEWVGQAIRKREDLELVCQQTGLTYQEVLLGLWLAINEFVKEYPEWTVIERIDKTIGVTVLAKRR